LIKPSPAQGVRLRTRAKAAVARLIEPIVEPWPRLPRTLVYHSISGSLERDVGQMRTSVRQLEEHLGYLRAERYDILDATTLVRRIRAGQPLSERTVALTFDDGYRDFIELAAPLFRRFDAAPRCS
jgi:peptidoglycan/xylan/chitin deacetylase (PgdA/CDA1 family)